MTTDTSTADKRGVEYMYIDYTTWLSRPILVGDKPKPHEVEYVRHDELRAMQARVKKAEAVLGLKDVLVQEERRVRIRAETARDGLRHEVEDLHAENRRLLEALLKVETYHREKCEKSKAEAAKYKSDEITDGAVEACLSDALLHLEASQYVGGLIAADRAALERKEGGT